ncbi:MAG TPA: ABC transporter ATP-binding protein [Flavipsychrobacter sp.]|jgi:ABC-type multidrug transport system ATPase subunit|nr:ABC transporter ATP-binding protein [Flavipsychrobacter sp.]
MKISLEHISKKFQRHWIFKEVNFSFTTPGAYALLGANGSGKSTLLRVIAGMQSPSAGKLFYYHGEGQSAIEPDKIYPYISYCAPAMEIVEEFTLKEFLKFHFGFKNALHSADSGNRLTIEEIISIIGLGPAADKPIADYSSGMKQRVKLAQAIFADTPVLLLDEPCTNLDQAGVEQYTSWIEQYAKDRLVVVASNDVREYFFCQQQIDVENYK